jgi:hypothetical protein
MILLAVIALLLIITAISAAVNGEISYGLIIPFVICLAALGARRAKGLW